MVRVPFTQHQIDPLRPFRPSNVGPFQQAVVVNGRERRYICYLPEEVRSSTAGVFVLADDRNSAQQLLAESNWPELAETDERKEKFIVFFLEPENGAWDLDDPSEDLQYIHEVYMASRARDRYCVHEAKYYLVGYGAGGAMAQMAAMDDPAVFAGVASVDAPEIDAAYIERTGNAACHSLNGYEDPDGRYGYCKRDFTVPAWIISPAPIQQTAEGNAARYWRICAGVAPQPHQLRPDVWEYVRTAPAPWTVNQESGAFRVWISQMDCAGKDFGRRINRRIWTEFLRGVRRWMAEPGGDLRMTKDPVADLGMEYHYELIDGWMREWYVYVPKYLRNNSSRAVPLVFAIHGYSCSGEIYAGNSEWHKVAEENGFIVIYPSAAHGYLRSDNSDNPAVGPNDTELPAWNVLDHCPIAPNELVFFETMLEKACAAYPIDRRRVFVTGHSLGSLMTQYLGMARPDLFAAIAPCSGVLFLQGAKIFPQKAEIKNRPDVKLPIWMFGGEREEWLLEAVPALENTTGQSIRIWWELNQMSGEKPVEFEPYRGPENGRWKDYVFSQDGVPMIRYTWVEAMPHATMTEMSYRIWDEFFSKFCRGSGGEICYG